MALPLPIVGDIGFDGDNREFSYGDGSSRAELWVDIDHSPTTTNPVTVKRKAFGESRWYTKDKLVDVLGKPFWWKEVRKDPFLGIEAPPDGVATAVVSDLTLRVTGQVEAADPFGLIKNVRVTFQVNGTNPLEPLAPAIDCRLDLLIAATGVPAFTYSLVGSHDGFPAYELYLQQRLVYSFNPVQAGTSPLSLGDPSGVPVNVPLTVFF
ncbi:MAG TPA: DUF3238 domain-containing protein [Actinoplanes sp.]|nr:DUF3238 domain-containing protein [Actinoplanes sp.]